MFIMSQLTLTFSVSEILLADVSMQNHCTAQTKSLLLEDHQNVFANTETGYNSVPYNLFICKSQAVVKTLKWKGFLIFFCMYVFSYIFKDQVTRLVSRLRSKWSERLGLQISWYL